MTSKLFLILIAELCWIIIFAKQENDNKQRFTSNFTIHWHFENIDELANITNRLDKLSSENEKLTQRLLKMEQAFKDCVEALKYDQQSGVYVTRIPGLQSSSVYCLSGVNGTVPWTIIQRRQNGSVDFDRNWQDYVNGFGNASSEYWIGLERLHKMTTAQRMELWVELEDYEGTKRSAFYDNFVIGGESEMYEFKELGAYSGNGRDFLVHLKGSKFSTKDKVNNEYGQNCAKYFKGGGWFGSCDLRLYWDGIFWSPFGGRNHLLKYVNMAIRPRNNN